MNKHNYPVWLSDDAYKKMLFQARGQLFDILSPLEMYGQKPFVDGAIDEIMEVIERVAKRIRGRDIPIIVAKKRNPR